MSFDFPSYSALITRRQFAKGAAATAAAITLQSTAAAKAASATETDHIAGLSLTEAAKQLRAGSLTSVQLTQACLDRIRIYNSKTFAYITVLAEGALGRRHRWTRR